MNYTPANDRYQDMEYRRCGNSGIKLPAISLGLWQNFGHINDFENSRLLIQTAFDAGITHFDLANNYGPPPGSAEENFGKILQTDFAGHRDEMMISSKAGYTMWNGPYGDWGSKKQLISSLDQSLKRMKLDYVDIFYHHRPDPETPLEETMSALHLLVQQGKALYIGLSNYKAPEAKKAINILRQMGTPCLIHQPKYSLFERWVEDGLLDLLTQESVGCIPFSPLAQGLLTDKYLHGIPSDSRAASPSIFLHAKDITPEKMAKIAKLNQIALGRGQKLAEMAVAWLLNKPQVTSVLIGASKVAQIHDAVNAVKNQQFTADELSAIDKALQ